MKLPNGYETKTTFWQDFSIADTFGKSAVKDTFKRAFKEWKEDYIYMTELSIVLNLKIWQYWENKNEEMSKVYNELWLKIENYIYDNFTEQELKYYHRVTD